jgi:hypothetical protein
MKRSLICLAACGNPAPAHVDAPVLDAAGDAGPCGSDTLFTGELVDVDSTSTAFCGVFDAVLQVHGDPARTARTSPNGRYRLCIASAATTRIDIAPPATASECTVPNSSYAVPGILIADRAVIAAGAAESARTFTVARAPAFGYQASAAQLLVHVDGAARMVSIDAAHDPAQAFDGQTWASGATGGDVLFPNVSAAAGAVTVTVAGGALGAGSVPVAAGTFTYVTVY